MVTSISSNLLKEWPPGVKAPGLDQLDPTSLLLAEAANLLMTSVLCMPRSAMSINKASGMLSDWPERPLARNAASLLSALASDTPTAPPSPMFTSLLTLGSASCAEQRRAAGKEVGYGPLVFFTTSDANLGTNTNGTVGNSADGLRERNVQSAALMGLDGLLSLVMSLDLPPNYASTRGSASLPSSWTVSGSQNVVWGGSKVIIASPPDGSSFRGAQLRVVAPLSPPHMYLDSAGKPAGFSVDVLNSE